MAYIQIWPRGAVFMSGKRSNDLELWASNLVRVSDGTVGYSPNLEPSDTLNVHKFEGWKEINVAENLPTGKG